MNAALKDKLATLPKSPGVYFHSSQNGEIIYVGKAAVLRNRVRQYFQSTKDMDVKTRALVAEIAMTDWVETDSEIDALFLESEMIKRYMPRYNVLLRDDKSQLFVRIDMKSEWPTVSFTRHPLDDGADYIGPYYNGYAVKKALRYLRRIFPYFTAPPKQGARIDLDVHIGLSPRPGTTSAEYKKQLRQLVRYMRGEKKQIISQLEKAMQQAARHHEFEEAALLRNKLQDMKALSQRIMFGDKEYLDISKDTALRDLRDLLGLKKAPSRIEGFDISHISGTDVVASMVVFTNGVSDRAQYRKFKMSQQKNDDYAQMSEVVTRRISEKNIASWGTPELLLIDGGKGQVMAAIEALEARGLAIPVIGVSKREEELLIHAHRSSVNTDVIEAYRLGERHDPGVGVLRDGDWYSVNLHVGQRNASGHSKNLRAARVGEVARYTHVTKLIQRIRDESHRFAISYHSTLRTQRQLGSKLEDIPGVGPVTRRTLLKKFGSLKGVSAATLEELQAAVGAKLGDVVYRHLSNDT